MHAIPQLPSIKYFPFKDLIQNLLGLYESYECILDTGTLERDMDTKILIAVKEKQLKKMIKDLNKQSMVLSPELKKKKEEALLKKKKEFERHVQDKNEEFAKSEKLITNKILKKMCNANGFAHFFCS